MYEYIYVQSESIEWNGTKKERKKMEKELRPYTRDERIFKQHICTKRTYSFTGRVLVLHVCVTYLYDTNTCTIFFLSSSFFFSYIFYFLFILAYFFLPFFFSGILFSTNDEEIFSMFFVQMNNTRQRSMEWACFCAHWMAAKYHTKYIF